MLSIRGLKPTVHLLYRPLVSMIWPSTNIFSTCTTSPRCVGQCVRVPQNVGMHPHIAGTAVLDLLRVFRDHDDQGLVRPFPRPLRRRPREGLGGWVGWVVGEAGRLGGLCDGWLAGLSWMAHCRAWAGWLAGCLVGRPQP